MLHPQGSSTSRRRQHPSRVIDSSSDFSRYDELRKNHADDFERIGTVDVLPSNVLHDGVNEEIALCHIAAMWRYSTIELNDTTNELAPSSLGPAFFGDSSSVLLAVHHFNNGMGVVVDEVEGINKTCNLRFTTQFFDTFSSIPKTVETFTDVWSGKNGDPKPCAVIGAFRSAVSAALSILTGVHGIPQLSPASSSPDLDNTQVYSFFSRIVPSDAGTSLLAVEYLLGLGVKHVGILFVDDSYGNAYQKAFKKVAEEKGMTTVSFSISFQPGANEISIAIAGLARSQFRYFFGIIFGPEHYDLVMKEAYDQGIAGNYEVPTFWMFAGGVERYIQDAKYPADSALAKATHGIGMIQAEGGIEGMDGYDRYIRMWKALDGDGLRYINSKQPTNYFHGDEDYFKLNMPERESIFAYDAVISLGLAGCKLLETSKKGTYFDGKAHFEEFVNTAFNGASGRIIIDPETTSRDPESALYVMFNAVTNETDEKGDVTFAVRPADIHFPSGDGWESLPGSPFIFVNGTLTPPQPLPALDKQYDHLGGALRISGLCLAAIVMLASIMLSLWTIKNRSSRIIKASQPIFLLLISTGNFLMGSTIIPLSIDDDVASIAVCNVACMSGPWLYLSGFVFCFAALYSKTQRINKIRKSPHTKRARLTAKNVSLPLLSLLAANFSVLTIWTILSPLQWARYDGESIDAFGRVLDSYGSCFGNAKESVPFFIILAVVNLGVLVIANQEAYFARNIVTEFFESRYTAIALMSWLQCLAIGIPLFLVVRGDNREQFLVVTCIIFVGCTAILLLIFGPKIIFHKELEDKRKGSLASQPGLQVAVTDVEDFMMNRTRLSGINALPSIFQTSLKRLVGREDDEANENRMKSDNSSPEKPFELQDTDHGSDNAESSSFDGSGLRILPTPMANEVRALRENIAQLEKDRDETVRTLESLLNDEEKELIDRSDIEEILTKMS